jgi:hypothetical protein
MQKSKVYRYWRCNEQGTPVGYQVGPCPLWYCSSATIGYLYGVDQVEQSAIVTSGYQVFYKDNYVGLFFSNVLLVYGEAFKFFSRPALLRIEQLLRERFAKPAQSAQVAEAGQPPP